MDIAFGFGDCIALGGYRYALLLVDVSTRYCWIYDLSFLSDVEIIAALEVFQDDTGALPKQFHAGFDKKLIGRKALKWIITNKSNVIVAPAGRQSSNGIAECTWRTIIGMAMHLSPKNKWAENSGTTPSTAPP